MRKIVLLWMGVWVCSSVALGGFDVTISSGYHGTQRLEGEESLLMTGGGAEGIEAFDSGYVEIWGSTPLQHVGGIHAIDLYDNSTMNYYGGETDVLYIRNNAQAVFQGGNVNFIRSFQDADDLVQVGWDEENNVPIFRKHIEMIVRNRSYDLQTHLLTGVWNVDNNNESQFDMFSIQ